jgi:hypothetical protein
MAPILSFLISSGSKKKEPRYVCPSEALVSLGHKILMTFESKKGTQMYFSFLSKVPANEPPLDSPTGPLWSGRPVCRAFRVSQKPHLSGSPVKEPSPKVPFMEFLAERCPTTRALFHSSIKVPGIRPPSHIPGSPRMEMGPHGERCPYPETFLAYLPGSPVKELPLRPPPRSLFRERCPITRAPSSNFQSPR